MTDKKPLLSVKEIVADFDAFRITHSYDMICSGTSPNTDSEIDQFGAVLNVGDSPYLSLSSYKDQPRLWLPILETAEWNLGNIFAAIRTLEQWHSEGRHILVHCAAGANRSPTIINLWRMYHYGPDALTERDYRFIEHNIKTGSLPKNITSLFVSMNRHKTWCGQVCVYDAGFKEETFTRIRLKSNKRYRRWGWFFRIKRWIFPPKPIKLGEL